MTISAMVIKADLRLNGATFGVIGTRRAVFRNNALFKPKRRGLLGLAGPMGQMCFNTTNDNFAVAVKSCRSGHTLCS
jgi:hypothetical protein